MARHEMAWSIDDSGNIMGSTQMNPILAMRMYQVAFARGKVTELTTNVIAKSINAHCNIDGNEYLS